MPEAPFISYAQNGEDVVLWRALQPVTNGRYVAVGANHPTDDSVTRAFYDRGWSGVTVEPVAHLSALHRAERPRDTQVQAAITSDPVDEVVLHVIPDSGLSTLDDDIVETHRAAGIDHVDTTVAARRLDDVLEENGFAGKEIHFLLIDVEGAEAKALESIDLKRWRPWVVVVEATLPNSTTPTHEGWEPSLLAAGYEFCLFDGVSRFYVAEEKAADLKANLLYPACALDRFVDHRLLAARAETAATTAEKEAEIAEKEAEVHTLTRQVLHWRNLSLQGWATAQLTEDRSAEFEEHFRAEVAAMQKTLSWRVTKPLRGVRRLGNIVRGRR